MLCLLVRAGGDQYAIDVEEIVQVLPLVVIRPLAMSNPAVAGVLNYQGTPVPVIDLGIHAGGTPSGRELHSRIVVVRCDPGIAPGGLLGLLADNVTTMMRCAPGQFRSSGVAAAPYLGGITHHADDMVQLLDPGRITLGAGHWGVIEPVDVR